MLEPLVLVVDDDPESGRLLADMLAAERCRVRVATDGQAALSACRGQRFDVVLSDVRMPVMDGVELLTRLRHMQPNLPVILITAEASLRGAVETVKRGAFGYVTKQSTPTELRRLIEEAVETRARDELPKNSSAAMPHGTEELIGESEPMELLRNRVELVAPAKSPVLVLGETGTGKELVARAIHACGPRRSRPFVTVNAAAIPEALLESELFGHVRGAFTGATTSHRGMLMEADGGTLLLDEIGDMPLGLQAKLLRVVQAGEIRAVGSERPQQVDVRIVAATHRALPELVREGRFREDLYYRLAVITLVTPPLRSRPADIPRLAEIFLARARTRAPLSPVTSISRELLDLLAKERWPGNVRELQSVIEGLVVLSVADELQPRHLALVTEQTATTDVPPVGPAEGAPSALDAIVRTHVEAVLGYTEGNKSRAAKVLGIDLSTLYRWQQKWK
jgi:two-component system response regulator HydG